MHELGHYVEAKRQGLNPQLPVFIPFLGAYVALRNQPFDPWRNALVSVAGPVAGGRRRARVPRLRRARRLDLLRALAYAGFFLNLINLVPIGVPRRRPHPPLVARAARAAAGAPTRPRRDGSRGVVAAYSSRSPRRSRIGMVASHVPQNRL